MVRRPPQGHCSTSVPNVCWWSVAQSRRGRLGMGAFTGRCLSAGDGVETGSAVTRGKTVAKCSPDSAARRAVHDGHHPRPLHEKAMSLDSLQRSHLTSTKPKRSCPQSRYRCASCLTRFGTHPDTEAQPRRKASSSTDFSGARRRPSSTPATHRLYSPPLTPRPACTPCGRGALRLRDGDDGVWRLESTRRARSTPPRSSEAPVTASSWP